MKLLNSIFLFFLVISCNTDYTPKPRGFFRIELPKKEYQLYTNKECGFSFQYPKYAEVLPDTDLGSEPCWLNINYTTLKGQLHLSYKKVNKNNLMSFIEDSRTLAYKHTIKAEAIGEKLVKTKNNVNGIIYKIEGNTASSIQFFVTDSVHHFFRGALYFPVAPQRDSLAPVIDFLSQDIEYMIATLKWEQDL